MKNTDIVIIGAGIAGLTAAIYLKRANANFILLEGNEVGGQLNKLKEVENYPGFKKVSGKEITDSILVQTKELGINITKASVQSILKEPEGFKVVSDVDNFVTKAVIIATGFARESTSIKGEKEYLGRGVSYCATCDGSFFKGDDVVVYGNNDVALEEALYLANIVNKLTLVNPDEKLSGDSKLVDNITKAKNVEIISGHKIVEVNGDMFGVSDIKLDDGRSIECHGVFPYVGKKSIGEFLSNLKPEMNNNFIVTNEEMETNIPGLFAIGDVRDKGLRQLVTASSDGAIAALASNRFVKSH